MHGAQTATRVDLPLAHDARSACSFVVVDFGKASGGSTTGSTTGSGGLLRLLSNCGTDPKPAPIIGLRGGLAAANDCVRHPEPRIGTSHCCAASSSVPRYLSSSRLV